MSGAKKKLERRMAKAQMGLTEREKQELQKKKAQQRNNIIAIVGGAIAVVLVAALLVWNSGFIARHTTVVKSATTEGTMADASLTRADMDYYYYSALNNYYSQEQSMASMYEQLGMEYTASFDPNVSPKKQYVDEAHTMTFHDYFQQQALSNATEIMALYNAAKAAGHTLSEDAQTSLDSAKADLDAQVTQHNMGSRTSYLRAIYGQSMNEKVYFKNLERSVWASDYYTTTTESMAANYSDAELEAYYADHTDELDSYDYDYVYFDGTAQPTIDENGESVAPTEDESVAALAAAKEDANDMLSNLMAGPTTDEEGNTETKSFTALASERGVQAYTQTDNAGSTFSGAPFDEWLMDAARADGDADVFEVEGSGYYVVQFHGRRRSDAPSSADVRHILIATSHKDDPATEDVDESQIPFTDEEVTAAHAEAERILQEFLSGEQTGERFGELAEQYSADGRNDDDGSLITAGGLYEDIDPTSSYVEEFMDWIFTADRKAGDTGIVKTTYGYHIMFADSVEEAKWKADSRDAMLSDAQQTFLEEVKAKYVISVDKWSDTPAQESAQPSAEDQEG